jgi:hypothetical protein
MDENFGMGGPYSQRQAQGKIRNQIELDEKRLNFGKI